MERERVGMGQELKVQYRGCSIKSGEVGNSSGSGGRNDPVDRGRGAQGAQ